MKQHPTAPAARDLLVHLAIGVGLGLVLSLALIVGNGGHVFEMIVNSSAPKATMALFVGVTSSLMGVGATLSGFVFTAMDDS
jgi:hypothetical protein